jgi:acetyl esterase/lipase
MFRGKRLPAVLIALVFLGSGIAWAEQARPKRAAPARPRLPDNVVVERDIQYGQAGDVKLMLDLVYPKKRGTGPLPVIVFIHGGAWRAGSKSTGILNLLPYATSGQYFGVTVEYRFTTVAQWPAQIHDCKAAIRWVRSQATKYNLNPDKIGVWGVSAGGHLVSLLGTSGDVKELEGDCGSPGVSSRVQCVVDFCGPSDFLAFAKFKRTLLPPPGTIEAPEGQLFGGTIAQKRELAIAASPVTYVSKDDPPFLIVHGTNDPLVNMEQAELLQAALTKAGASATLVKIIGGGHLFGGSEVSARVGDFFAKHLRDQDVSVSGEAIRAPLAPQPGAAKGKKTAKPE